MFYRILTYIEHQFYRRHRKGHHIHSPYLFDFVHEVIFNASKCGVAAGIREVHRELRKDPMLIPSGGPGASSNASSLEKRSVGSFVKHASVSPKYGALLYRISRWFKPDVILEMGTGLGVSTLYLAAAAPGVPLHTIEGNEARADFSSHLIKRCGFFSVKVHVGEMEEMLGALEGLKGKRLLAFVDGNHQYGPTLKYIRRLMALAGEEAVIVMDDIYWSEGMQRAWKEIIRWPEVRVSIDLFHMGILLMREDLAKSTLKMKF